MGLLPTDKGTLFHKSVRTTAGQQFFIIVLNDASEISLLVVLRVEQLCN